MSRGAAPVPDREIIDFDMQQAVSVPSTHAGHALPSNPGALSVPSIRAALRRARVEIEGAAEIKRATPPPGLCWVLGTKRKGALPREFSLSAAVWVRCERSRYRSLEFC